MEVVVDTVFGPMTVLETDARIGHELRTRGCWDLKEILDSIQWYERFAPSDSHVILDIGSNVGAWTLPIARRYSKCQVIAFECQEFLYRCLCKTIEANGLNNVQSHCMAISDQPGTIRYGSIDYTWGGNFGAFELEPPHHNSDFNGRVLPGRFEEIEQRTIDSFNFERVGLIKIDVEGMELKVIRGALNTLQRCQSVVLFEHHKSNREEIHQLLESINYRIADSFSQMTCAVPKK